jgi:hypothetical protein
LGERAMIQKTSGIEVDNINEFDNNMNFVDAVFDVLLVIDKNDLYIQLDPGTIPTLLLTAKERFDSAKNLIKRL